jgi:hypothetical protein
MLCPVMQMDFTHGTGRHDERGRELYDDADLRTGVAWAEHWIAEGESAEPAHGYDLATFKAWCERKLNGGA